MSSDSSSMRVAYSLAAGAAAATALSAGADVIYSGLQDLSIGQFSSLNLNVDGDAYGDVLLKNYVFGGGNYMGATVNFAPGGGLLQGAAALVAIGALVIGSDAWLGGFAAAAGDVIERGLAAAGAGR